MCHKWWQMTHSKLLTEAASMVCLVMCVPLLDPFTPRVLCSYHMDACVSIKIVTPIYSLFNIIATAILPFLQRSFATAILPFLCMSLFCQLSVTVYFQYHFKFIYGEMSIYLICKYSRTSEARTQIALLPRLFQTRS